MRPTDWAAVLIGTGSGALGLAMTALLVWLALSSMGVEAAVGAATVAGTLAGFALAGVVAGRRARGRPFFHGAMSALLVAVVVTITAVRSGSPAPLPQVLLLAGVAMAIGGSSGSLGGRRRPPE